MHQVVKRVNRSLISVASLFLPEEKGRELERLRRGKEDTAGSSLPIMFSCRSARVVGPGCA
jgi:hypothetical protein